MAHILVVDDDDDLRPVLHEFLLGQGYEVRVARDGEDGLRALAEGLPDVILLDVDMPVLDGPGMAARIMARDAGVARIPIVLLSGMANLPETARKLGTPYFSTKPISPEALVALVDRALTERTAPQSREV